MAISHVMLKKSENLSVGQRQALLWVVRGNQPLQRDALRFIDDDDFSGRLLHAMLVQFVDDWNERWYDGLQLRLASELVVADTLEEFWQLPEAPEGVLELTLRQRRFATGVRTVLLLRLAGRTYTYADFLWTNSEWQPAETQHIFNYLDFYASNSYYVLAFLRDVLDEESARQPIEVLTRLQTEAEQSRQKAARAISKATMRQTTLQILSDGNNGQYHPIETEEPMQVSANYRDEPSMPASDALTDNYFVIDQMQSEIYYNLHSPHQRILYQSRVLNFDVAFQLLRQTIHNVLDALGLDSRVPPRDGALQQRSPTYLTLPPLERLVLDTDFRRTQSVAQLEEVRRELLRRLRALLVAANQRGVAFTEAVDAQAERQELQEDLQLLVEEHNVSIEVEQAVVRAVQQNPFILPDSALTVEDYASLARFGLFLTDRLVGYFCRDFLASVEVDFRAAYNDDMLQLLDMRNYERENAFQVFAALVSQDEREECEVYYDAERRQLKDPDAIAQARRRTEALRLSAHIIGDPIFRERRSSVLLFGNNFYVENDIIDTGVTNATAYLLVIFAWQNEQLFMIRVGDADLHPVASAFVANLIAFEPNYYYVPKTLDVVPLVPPRLFHRNYLLIGAVYSIVQALQSQRDVYGVLEGWAQTDVVNVEQFQSSLLSLLNEQIQLKAPEMAEQLRLRYGSQFEVEYATDEEKMLALITRLRQFDPEVPGPIVIFYLAPLVTDLVVDGRLAPEGALGALMRQLLALRRGGDFNDVPGFFDDYRRAQDTREVEMQVCLHCRRQTWRIDKENRALCGRCQQVYSQ